MTITGIPAKAVPPGSPEWLQSISASKVPAILGISPWQSRFALWHLMAGNTQPWDGNKSTERGTFLEAAVLDWFRTKHPDDTIHKGRAFHHTAKEHWTAAPDAWCDDPDNAYGVEVKTSQYSDGWGEPGTAQIPPYYLAQVVWQMVVCGFDKVHVPVLFGQPFEFREYIVNRADIADDIPFIIEEVARFEESLKAGEQPPIEGSDSTYQAIKELHPEIDGETIELPDALVSALLESRECLAAAEDAFGEAKNLIADHMGTAKKATWRKSTIYTRQAKNGGTPYLVIGRSLPTLNQKEDAA